MPEIFRSRDCIIFFKGTIQPVAIDPVMVAGGWPGGQGVKWVNLPGVDLAVTYSDGLYGGFLIWGSDEDGDQFVSNTRSQVIYRYGSLFFGGGLISTRTYEQYTWASRTAGGPLVPLTYGIQDILYLSSRGWWTKEDEMTLSGHLMAPAFSSGVVAQVPKANNRYFMGIQTGL